MFRRRLYALAVDSYPTRVKVRYNLGYYQELSGATDLALRTYAEATHLLESKADKTLTVAEIEQIEMYIEESVTALSNQ